MEVTYSNGSGLEVNRILSFGGNTLLEKDVEEVIRRVGEEYKSTLLNEGLVITKFGTSIVISVFFVILSPPK